MKTNILLGIMLVVSSFALSFQTAGNGNLTVTVTNIKNTNGEIDFNLFNAGKGGFPDDATKTIRHTRSKIMNGTCTITFENIPFGVYAVSIYHDENNNQKFDQTWYGKPTEGVGVSNNPKVGIFSPPKFETAKFNFDNLKNSISIKIKYL
jgi:uncharacterized protein (DUF2141 family)